VAVGKRKGLAIASLVCAIIGGWASTATIPAVICGHLALSRMKKNPQEFGGKGIALAGLILGYFGLGLALILGATRGYTSAMVLRWMNNQ
jgi:peptidyl-prolyl cis-trans isomerase B (cyclophilin B)